MPPVAAAPASAPSQPGNPPADTPVSLYRRLTRKTPNPVQRSLLGEKVHDLACWQATLEHWLAHDWNPFNLPGMLEMYFRGAKCRYCLPGAVGKSSRMAKCACSSDSHPPAKASGLSRSAGAFQVLRQRYPAALPA